MPAMNGIRHQRRQHDAGRRRPLVEHPADAELEVVRRDVLEVHRVVDGIGAVEGHDVAGDAVAEMDVAIRELEGQVRRRLVGQTRMQRPGEVPLAGARRVGDAVVGDVGVGEVADRDVRAADSGADERRHRVPGAEIDIGVREEQPFRLQGAILVGLRTADDIEAGEGGLAAIFAGHVETQPVVPLIADAEAENRRAVEVLVHDVDGAGEQRVVETADLLIAHADVAAEIPASGEILDGRQLHRGKHRRHVGRCGRRRKQSRKSGNRRDLHAHHD
jgi:hypothetical protein